jgi:L-asparaginase
MTKRILILHTGGTISMVQSDQGYVPSENFPARLHEQLDNQNIGGTELPIYNLLETDHLIDSANSTPKDWTAIADLLSEHWHKYDGFVVLHGTDTMAYTASALSFILGEIDKPVILTGSQIPLVKVRNDALRNLIISMMLAANYDIHEVCIYFNGKLLRGNRSTKLKSMQLDAFQSPNFPDLATVGIDVDVQQSLLLPASKPDFKSYNFDPEAVAIVPMYPGVPANIVNAILTNQRIKALILQTYGVGNPPDANKLLMQRLTKANKDGIIVVNLSQCLVGGVFQGSYATGATLNKIGIVGGADLTLEAAFTKLHFLLASGHSSADIKKLMPTPIRGECR